MREFWPTSSISLSDDARETKERMYLAGENHDAAQRQHRQRFGNFDFAQILFGLETLFPFGAASDISYPIPRLRSDRTPPTLSPPPEINVLYRRNSHKVISVTKEQEHDLLRTPSR